LVVQFDKYPLKTQFAGDNYHTTPSESQYWGNTDVMENSWVLFCSECSAVVSHSVSSLARWQPRATFHSQTVYSWMLPRLLQT